MSGFVALLRGDGSPVEPDAIERLTAAMEYRAPDGTATWTGNGAGLGHAAFVTLDDPPSAAQPLELDRRLWLVADARLDDRARLVAALARRGRPGLDRAPDELLLVHAYDVWGEPMVDHLLGDFAFVVWDASRRELFGARDHMGVKPFYYATVTGGLVAGNTIDSLRAHGSVPDTLDEHAIADYLLFGLNRHPQRTSFAAIRRLPPAHTLRWRPGEAPRVTRYWRLHVEDPVVLADDHAIVERFDELLTAAVKDRLRGKRLAVSMSGGLDSTAVAAVAHEILSARHTEFELAALTFAYRRLLDDPEPRFAARVAESLDIPLHTIALDDDHGADHWAEGTAWSAEPTDLPASARTVGRIADAMPGMRVALTGQGGDPLLHVTPEDAAHRLRRGGALATATAVLRYRRAHGRLPRAGLRTWLRRRLRGRRFETPPLFPPWLRPELVDRLGLRERHATFVDRSLDAGALRPEAEFQLAGGEWSYLLEWYDPGMTGFRAEYRHPLLDVRLIELLLAVPVIPWLVEKEILRRAMRDRLPAAVLRRRKAPLAANPVHRALIANDEGLSGLARRVPALAEFIDVERFSGIAAQPRKLHPWEYELVTRPLGLALWLSRLEAGSTDDGKTSSRGGRRYARQALP